MAELVWSLNGKYFKDFGVGISSSDGILGELKPKKQDTKDWPEYNGTALDLTKKPKYEAREFTLSGWIVGADWLIMLNNFNALFGEFRNAGKQRLLLDVFGQKTLVFDVRCEDEIELKKTFKQGKMVGMFSLKLIEHNPIKKILYTANSNLQLSFNTPKWVEVNIDGKIDVYKGTVNINKTLTNRVVTGYNFGGRNYFKSATDVIALNGGTAEKWQKGIHLLGVQGQSWVIMRLNNVITSNGFWTISFDAYANNDNIQLRMDICDNTSETFIINKSTKKITKSFNVQNYSDVFNFIDFDVSWNHYYIDNIKVEQGNKATDWKPAPEDQHYVSIAGNIDEITGLTTNADVLWEKL